MIEHICVDTRTHDAVAHAARDAGMTYDNMLALIVEDWAAAYRQQIKRRAEIKADLASKYPNFAGGVTVATDAAMALIGGD